MHIVVTEVKDVGNNNEVITTPTLDIRGTPSRGSPR